MLEDWLRNAIADYGHQCTTKLQDGVGQPEAAIRGPVEGFLTNIGQATGLEVVVHDEAHKAQAGARPDFAVRVAGAIPSGLHRAVRRRAGHSGNPGADHRRA
ncbi:hypothetical protein GCM10023405_31520 [Streptomonospora salina]